MAGEIVHVEFPARDADRTTAFYNGLFGWEFKDSGMPGIDYRMFEGQPGGAVYTSESPESGPIVYFGTDDIEAAIAKVRELGGEADDKQPIPGVGWFTRVKDPDGNAWSFFQGDESVAPPGGGS